MRPTQQQTRGPQRSSMIKPQQHGELLLRDSLAVFGKPWYWQRSSGAMESTRSLAQVIVEMRDEIKKLEAENQELRGSAEAGMEENPYANLRRNASAPALEGQYKGESIIKSCDTQSYETV